MYKTRKYHAVVAFSNREIAETDSVSRPITFLHNALQPLYRLIQMREIDIIVISMMSIAGELHFGTYKAPPRWRRRWWILRLPHSLLQSGGTPIDLHSAPHPRHGSISVHFVTREAIRNYTMKIFHANRDSRRGKLSDGSDVEDLVLNVLYFFFCE